MSDIIQQKCSRCNELADGTFAFKRETKTQGIDYINLCDECTASIMYKLVMLEIVPFSTFKKLATNKEL